MDSEKKIPIQNNRICSTSIISWWGKKPQRKQKNNNIQGRNWIYFAALLKSVCSLKIHFFSGVEVGKELVLTMLQSRFITKNIAVTHRKGCGISISKGGILPGSMQKWDSLPYAEYVEPGDYSTERRQPGCLKDTFGSLYYTRSTPVQEEGGALTTFPKALCNVALFACALGTLPSRRPAGSVDPQVRLLQFECEQIRVSERPPPLPSVAMIGEWNPDVILHIHPLILCGEGARWRKGKGTVRLYACCTVQLYLFAHGYDFMSGHFRFGNPTFIL